MNSLPLFCTSTKLLQPVCFGLGMVLLTACAPRTVVMVRDTHDAVVAGSALGEYGYPQSSEGKDGVRSYGSPRTLESRVSDVRSGEVVSAHTVGAYVDPVNRNLLHQPHVVVRLDQSARWRLAPAASGAPLLHGPAAGVIRREYAPGATAGETGREIMASRRAMEATAAAVGRVEAQQQKLVENSDQNQDAMLKNQKSILQIVRAQDERIGRVEKQQQSREAISSGPRFPLNNGGPGNTAETAPATPPPITSAPTVGATPAASTRSGVY